MMMRKLIQSCELFCKGGRFDLALFDDNDNSCFSRGEFRLSNEDVSCVRTLLTGNCTGPYVLHIGGAGFICLKSSDQILYGRRGFNELTESSNKSNGSIRSSGDVVSGLNASDVNRNQEGHETNTANVEEDNNPGVEDDNASSYISDDENNELNVKAVFYDNAGLTNDDDVVSRKVIKPLDKQTVVNIKCDNNNEGSTVMTGNNGTSFSAMLVRDYVVLMHGRTDGKTSWLLRMADFRANITKYI